MHQYRIILNANTPWPTCTRTGLKQSLYDTVCLKHHVSQKPLASETENQCKLPVNYQQDFLILSFLQEAENLPLLPLHNVL